MAMTRMDSIDALRSGVDTLFKALENADVPGSGITMGVPITGRGVSSTFCMPLDIIEEDNAYMVDIDVPGCVRENISLKVDEAKSTITVTSERKAARPEEPESAHKLLMRERGGGRIRRTVTLPTEADLEKAEAELKEGVLRLTVPKCETRSKRKLQIK
ncbi:heat shock protein 20 [Tribonema minus]|uniref:Heat shock protein 20 n=1 Tax=Tribonema minus TaxID=303371 RepID=A0A836CH99_9STRA|nr:heat shock protein 20 [Tribonema minus]